MDDFMTGWFRKFSEGLNRMSDEESERLFSCCAAECAKDALKYLYQGHFDKCGKDPDRFFDTLHEVRGVEGSVVEPGRVYDLIFLECNCPIHTEGGVTSGQLCCCSKGSIICEIRQLMPGRVFNVTKLETILGGDPRCRFRIEFDATTNRI